MERDVADLDWQGPKCTRVIPEFPTLGDGHTKVRPLFNIA